LVATKVWNSVGDPDGLLTIESELSAEETPEALLAEETPQRFVLLPPPPRISQIEVVGGCTPASGTFGSIPEASFDLTPERLKDCCFCRQLSDRAKDIRIDRAGLA
jgi:hypothetical protein